MLLNNQNEKHCLMMGSFRTGRKFMHEKEEISQEHRQQLLRAINQYCVTCKGVHQAEGKKPDCEQHV